MVRVFGVLFLLVDMVYAVLLLLSVMVTPVVVMVKMLDVLSLLVVIVNSYRVVCPCW